MSHDGVHPRKLSLWISGKTWKMGPLRLVYVNQLWSDWLLVPRSEVSLAWKTLHLKLKTGFNEQALVCKCAAFVTSQKQWPILQLGFPHVGWGVNVTLVYTPHHTTPHTFVSGKWGTFGFPRWNSIELSCSSIFSKCSRNRAGKICLLIRKEPNPVRNTHISFFSFFTDLSLPVQSRTVSLITAIKTVQNALYEFNKSTSAAVESEQSWFRTGFSRVTLNPWSLISAALMC